MSKRSASKGAWWALAGISVLSATGLVLEVVNVPAPQAAGDWGTGSLGDYLFVAMMFSFPVIGALIASRHPHNAIGWIMLGIGAVQGLGEVMDGYTRYAMDTDPGSLPRPDIVMALNAGLWAPVIGPIATFLILLFPDGRLPSPRWRPLAWMAGLGITAAYLVITVAPGDFSDLGYPGVENPLGLGALRPVLDLLLSVLVLIPLSVLGCAAALVTRFRRSRHQERLQMKWLATAGAVVAVIYGVTMAASLMAGFDERANVQTGLDWVMWLQEIAPLSFGLIPAAIGVAVLRHKLYDIDLIVNRTIVYALLTTMLSGVYLAVVALSQGVLRPVTGDSDLAVAIATLAVAALFRPARAAVQSFIDRRFYRCRYDAALTLETFAHQLRDEVDIRTIAPALVGVVSNTLQPSHLSLWLRQPEESGAR